MHLTLPRATLAIALIFVLAGFGLGLLLFPAKRTGVAVPAHDLGAYANRARLLMLAIGVSRYDSDAFPALEFAHGDAVAVSEAFGDQASRDLYGAVEVSLVTDGEATRESILSQLRDVAARARPTDVVIVFFAGHGVVDPESGAYFFLAHDARPASLPETAVAMAEIDEWARITRQRSRSVVLLLDTCHAGALRTDHALGPPADFPSAIPRQSGLFLLAATGPGDRSQEHSRLAHGVFTHALLRGVAGASDRDGNGVISVSELFGHVAKEVARLTDGTQKPYYRLEGTDIGLAAAERVASETASPAALRAVGGNRIAVARFENLSGSRSLHWIGEALRMAFTTELSKVAALDVVAPELVDSVAERGSLDSLESAKHLGVDRLITGSFSVVGDRIHIDARIVAVDVGSHEGSESVEGSREDFFDLQKQLVLRLLRRLRVRLTPMEGRSIEGETNTDVDAYRLLLQSEDVFDRHRELDPDPRNPDGSAPELSAPPGGVGPRSTLDRDEDSAWRRIASWVSSWCVPSVAFAAEPATSGDASEAIGEIVATLERYRAALEAGDLDAIDRLYAVPTSERREHQSAYLRNALELEVEIVDVDATLRDGGALVSFTRRDRFVDRKTGREQRLEVRLTRMLRRNDGAWQIVGKP